MLDVVDQDFVDPALHADTVMTHADARGATQRRRVGHADMATRRSGSASNAVQSERYGMIGHAHRGACTVTGARRKESFDEAAEDYDRWRAGYPEGVVVDMLACAHIDANSRVLEVGCGTGQLSVALAVHGAELVAVELGPNLAAIARQNLGSFPKARVETGAFEDWPLPPEPFDAVVVANAFHWLDPEVRVSKSAEALKLGGHLTIAHAHHILGGTPGFFEATQQYYLKWGLSDDPFFQPPTVEDAPIMYPELDDRPEFGPVRRDRFEIARQHTAESYLGWLKTDSLIATLDADARDGFLNDVGHLVDTGFQGTVSRNFLYEVITTPRIQ
jgi:SAM-dependent methyltransferase